MSSQALVQKVESEIRKVFDVSSEEAHGEAWLLVAHAEGWGSPEHAQNLDWTYLVKKNLDGKFKWKSDGEREAFHSEEKRVDDEKKAKLKYLTNR